MAIQLAVTTRNARLDAIETDLGASPILKFFTGAQPANCAAADTGTQLAAATLPADFMTAASAGSKGLSGTWEDTAADNSGTAQHFRMYTSGGVCKLQGSVTGTGGGGDMEVSNTSFTSGGTVTVTAFTLTDANA